jgi:hypothetical protein
MKKKRDERKKEIVLDFLKTKFDGKELRIEESRYTETYKRYYLGDTLLMETWMSRGIHKGNFGKKFLEEFATWFPKFKYKRRILKDWFITNYNPTLPEGCEIYVP